VLLSMSQQKLSHADLLGLKRWNTPTIYNGWEQITNKERTGGYVNIEEVRDFMPQMGPMVGYAVTAVFEPSNPSHPKNNPEAWGEYREYLASVPGPKIVVTQDLDHPECAGTYWGEVNANVCRSLGCVGCIQDGAIRDVDEMTNAGFKTLARRLCVGHAYSCPVRWNCEVDVFGIKIKPGQLIHADKHGFIVIPEEDQDQLLEAARFMDQNECNTFLSASREAIGKTVEQNLDAITDASSEFARATLEEFGR
jgi:4-hydroxy-4-methyl-2-oxoglutarate aldolase